MSKKQTDKKRVSLDELWTFGYFKDGGIPRLSIFSEKRALKIILKKQSKAEEQRVQPVRGWT